MQRQASGRLGCSLRREKACRTRGERAQTSGCLSHWPRREKAPAPGERPPELLATWAARRGGEKGCRTRGEATETSGCLARTQRVLPIHSDICLQRPTLPTAGLN